jgi:predicted Abi (CAAX) family protease
VFVAAHLLIPGERARKTFWDPAFLVMAGVFGAMCSAVYYLTGSLLVIWLVHGVPVAIWLLLLGGAEKVQ